MRDEPHTRAVGGRRLYVDGGLVTHDEIPVHPTERGSDRGGYHAIDTEEVQHLQGGG